MIPKIRRAVTNIRVFSLKTARVSPCFWTRSCQPGNRMRATGAAAFNFWLPGIQFGDYPMDQATLPGGRPKEKNSNDLIPFWWSPGTGSRQHPVRSCSSFGVEFLLLPADRIWRENRNNAQAGSSEIRQGCGQRPRAFSTDANEVTTHGIHLTNFVENIRHFYEIHLMLVLEIVKPQIPRN